MLDENLSKPEIKVAEVEHSSAAIEAARAEGVSHAKVKGWGFYALEEGGGMSRVTDKALLEKLKTALSKSQERQI